MSEFFVFRGKNRFDALFFFRSFQSSSQISKPVFNEFKIEYKASSENEALYSILNSLNTKSNTKLHFLMKDFQLCFQYVL